MVTLTPVPGATRWRLDAPAAASLGRAIAAGCPVDITSTYRDPAEQQRLYDGWCARKPGFNFALPPSQSHHCMGIAVDADGAMQAWLVTHGAAYGWIRDKNEPWHFDYVTTRDTHQEDDMAITDDDVKKIAGAILNYKNPNVSGGDADVYALLRQSVSYSRAAALRTDDTDEAQIAALVLDGLTPAKIAAAIPANLARQVADELAKRLAS
jgi:hypothetical protein